jgi:hypothetical protein
MAALNLEVVPGTFAVTKLAPGSPTPDWATRGVFTSVTRTTEELSIVCPEENVPADVKSERGWNCLRVAGQLDFSMVGVIASLVRPLAKAGIAVFVISTFATDYLMLKVEGFERAVQALARLGHRVRSEAY